MVKGVVKQPSKPRVSKTIIVQQEANNSSTKESTLINPPTIYQNSRQFNLAKTKFYSLKPIIMHICKAIKSDLYFGIPKASDPTPVVSKNHQKKSFDWLQGYLPIIQSGNFKQVFPMGIFNIGGFYAIQTLWLGNWFRDYIGLSEPVVANYLFLFNLMLLLGYAANMFIPRILHQMGLSIFKYVSLDKDTFLYLWLSIIIAGARVLCAERIFGNLFIFICFVIDGFYSGAVCI